MITAPTRRSRRHAIDARLCPAGRPRLSDRTWRGYPEAGRLEARENPCPATSSSEAAEQWSMQGRSLEQYLPLTGDHAHDAGGPIERTRKRDPSPGIEQRPKQWRGERHRWRPSPPPWLARNRPPGYWGETLPAEGGRWPTARHRGRGGSRDHVRAEWIAANDL